MACCWCLHWRWAARADGRAPLYTWVSANVPTNHKPTEPTKRTEPPPPPLQYGEGQAPDVWFDPVAVWEVKAADLSVSPVHQAARGLVDPGKGISIRWEGA